MTETVPTTLFDVLEATCTVEQIQGLVRKYKDQHGISELRITGNKPDVISSLRSASEGGRVPTSEIVNLIRDHEEAGNQHIFYFTPKSGAAAKRLADGKRIGEILVGKRLTDGTLPSYTIKPLDFVWADFRYSTGRPLTWTAKIYGHQQRTVFRREDDNPTSVIRYYDKTETRLVCLAHWNGQELELRVSRSGAGGAIDHDRSRNDEREIDKRLLRLQSFIAPAKVMDDVQAWDLTPACRKMVKAVLEEHDAGVASEDSELSYMPSSVRFRDPAFGTAIFNTHEDAEGLASDESRHDAIRVYLDGDNSLCRQVIVLWDERPAAGIWGERPLRTVIGGKNSHEIIIGANVNAQTVQYVTNELRKASQ